MNVEHYWMIAGAAFLLSLYIILIFNRLVRRKNMVQEAWSNIDVQLKRRHILIPNLLETVKSYMNFEENLLIQVTNARNECVKHENDGPSVPFLNHENQLSVHLAQFWGLVENYPDLKAIKAFNQFQKDLTDTEDQIQLARRYYNGAVRDLNIMVESFPSNLVAKLFRYKTQLFFQIENPMAKNAPKVKLGRT